MAAAPIDIYGTLPSLLAARIALPTSEQQDKPARNVKAVMTLAPESRD